MRPLKQYKHLDNNTIGLLVVDGLLSLIESLNIYDDPEHEQLFGNLITYWKLDD